MFLFRYVSNFGIPKLRRLTSSQLRPLHYQVHPVVLAQGRMPDAMEDSEVPMMKCMESHGIMEDKDV